MKKWIAVLLSLLLAFSMAACSAVDGLQKVDIPPLPEVTEEPEAPAVTEAPEESPTALPEMPEDMVPEVDASLSNRVSVNFVTSNYEAFDPSAGIERILTFSYVTPKIRIDGRDAAAEAINEYVAMLDETYYTGNDYGDGSASGFNGMLELAEDNYTYAVTMGERSLPLEFSASRTARVERIDSRVIDLVLSSYEYTGGAHGNYWDSAYVFDAETGARLKLEDLSEDAEALRAALVDAMIQAVNDDPAYYEYQIPEDFVAPEDYETAFAALLREGSWYFGNDGLVVFSTLYELGPYASGITEFTIGYDKLSGVIDDKWLPAAREGAGEFTVLPLSEIEEGSVELLDKVTVREGPEICLLADGTVYDVNLSTVYYADRFYEQEQLWCSSYMSNA
ncbi:MAG: DUF3298 domain-containing protein, partial [Oscillospiraceae bacterium]|nr:DUF3298 domain-containing protein [Oscillospiraceae bacterium]